MSTILRPSTPESSPGRRQAERTVSAEIVRPILIALSLFVVVAGIGLAIALVTGAILVFNIVVWAAFTVLWIAFAAALALSPGTLDDLWHLVRERPIVIQGIAWVLFLPIMIGLWTWERAWALPVRLILVAAIGAFNVLLFFPHW